MHIRFMPKPAISVALLLTWICLLDPAAADKNHRVGVIGGGAAGLTTAYLLQEKGYQVTVLEQAAQVGGLARTEKVNGKNYDMSTMFIPGGSIAGAGIEPTLQQMIDVSKEKISPAVDFSTLNADTQLLELIPEVLQEYEPNDIVQQLLLGLTYSTQLFLCFVDASTCATCGDVCASANDPLAVWGDTWGVPAYAKLILYAFDGLGGGPSTFVATFSSTLLRFATVDVAHVLVQLGVTPDSLPPGTPSNIVSLLTSERWYFFDRGYQTFWIHLVKQAKLDVVTSVQVETMDHDDAKDIWTVYATNGAVFEFDQVVVTTAPQDAFSFLPDGPQKDLIATAFPRSPPNDIFIVRSADRSTDVVVDQDVTAFWPTGFGLGTPGLASPSIGGVIKPFFYQKRHDRNTWVIATYNLDPTLSAKDVFEAVETYSKDVLGLVLEGEFLHHQRYVFPSGPLDWEAWSAAWTNLQGQNGLWFNGEAFAGSGVPRITQFTKQLIERAF